MTSSATIAQNQLLGGPCEGCEAVFEFGDRELSAVDTLPEFYSEGTQIKISGTVFNPDETSPASDVILYVYQTNEEGVYPKKGNETGWARRHGYLRGWVKTDENGKYTIFSQLPMFYGNEPAHIHLTVLEPDGSYYYVESFLFEGGDNLNSKHLKNPKPRGGFNGIMKMQNKNGMLVGKRDLILRKNL
ncbi:MAG: hypothetical protein JJ895_12855 [Balneolaceae bacterium]|nr:hypothetical protein [Balneolaceae bacterium]